MIYDTQTVFKMPLIYGFYIFVILKECPVIILFFCFHLY